MNYVRGMLSACVVKDVPNARDYAYKTGEMLLEEKRQREMAIEMGRNRQEQKQEEYASFERGNEQCRIYPDYFASLIVECILIALNTHFYRHL
jgi:hypothetical protein